MVAVSWGKMFNGWHSDACRPISFKHYTSISKINSMTFVQVHNGMK